MSRQVALGRAGPGGLCSGRRKALPEAVRAANYGWFPAALLLAILLGWTEAAATQDFNPVVFFNENCAMCHTIGGGPGAGPDLKDVHQKADRNWLTRFLLDPEGMVSQGDQRALALVEEFGGMVMPAIAMTSEQAETLLLWMEWESARVALEQGEAVAAGTADRSRISADSALLARELTPEDAWRGRAYFEGRQSLSGGGPACISCHTVQGLSGLGGGKLGPDLTAVSARLGGRRGLQAWLQRPPLPTMRLLYRDPPLTAEEILAVTAFLEQSAAAPPVPQSAGLWQFLVLGVAGTALGLLLFELIWRSRLRSVRAALLHASRR